MTYNMSALETAELAQLGIRVYRPSEQLSSGEDLFTVVKGNCFVSLFLGKVATATVDSSADLAIQANPTTGSSTIIAAELVIDNDQIGTLYTVEGLFDDQVQEGSSGSVPGAEQGFVVAPGVIEATIDDGSGYHEFTLWYVPLETGAYIEVA